MKYIFLLVFTLLLSPWSYSQVVTVRDKDTKQPLDLVTLASESPRTFTTTNPAGQAEISSFTGSARIEIRMVGYKTVRLSFEELKNAHFKVLLEKSVVSLDQVVVSATRWNQSNRDIPSKITVISAHEVALENPQTAADMLAESGEVFIQKSQQAGGSPMIRGFSTNRLLYVVDGVRMNTAIFRSGNLQNVISLDPFATERTEVFFGPGSVIYGSDAIGGVMSFQTLTPQLTLSDETLINGKALARYSSANHETTGHFNVNIGWKKWALTTSFSSFNFDDLRMGSDGPDEYLRKWYVQRIDSADVVITNDDPAVQTPTRYSQINLMQKIRFQPDEKWDFQYGFHYSATNDYSRYDRLLRTKNGLPRSAEWYYGPQKWMMNHLTITNNANNVVYDQLIMHLSQQYFEESRIDRDFNDTERRHRVEKVDAYSINFDFHKAYGEKNTFIYGLEFVWDDVTSTGTDEDIITGEMFTGPSRYPQSTWSSYAAYLNYQYKLSPKSTLQAGLRYNQFALDADFSNNMDFYPFPDSVAKINDGALTGNVGIVFNPTEKWVLSANISTGFRAPNVDDMGKVFDSEPGSVIVPNPDLKSEYAYNFEAGVAKVFDDFVKIDLSAYYTILQDAMVRRDYSLNGMDSIMYDGEMSKVQAIQNAAMATVYGLQAGLEMKLPAGFSLSSQFNYQVGEEELDNGSTSPSRHAAPMFGITRLKYASDNLEMQLYAIYSGQKKYEDLPTDEQGKTYIYAEDENGNPYSPRWYTLNFKALYQLTDILAVSAGVENLTNQLYRPYSSGIAGPGRNFILSVQAAF